MGTTTILSLCLSLFSAATHGGITAQTGPATFHGARNGTQHQSEEITAPQEPVPRLVHVLLYTVKKQQTLPDPHAEV